MSDATTAAPAASPTPDPATASPAPAPAPAPAAAAPAAAAPAPTAAPAAAPAPTAAPAAAPKADDAPPGAPEKYEDFAIAEGLQPDPVAMDQFKAVAKELNLTQEAAQRLVTMNTESVVATVNGWKDLARADKEFGGDKFDASLATAKAALDKFATPEFKAFLDRTGFGYHPEMIRTFLRAGQAISQDGFVPGRQGAPAPSAQTMYSKSNMNP